MSNGNECFCKLSGRKTLVIGRMKQGGCNASLFRGATLVVCIGLVMTKKSKVFPHSLWPAKRMCDQQGALTSKGLCKPHSHGTKKYITLWCSQVCDILAALHYFIWSGLPYTFISVLLISNGMCQPVCMRKGWLLNFLGSWTMLQKCDDYSWHAQHKICH